MDKVKVGMLVVLLINNGFHTRGVVTEVFDDFYFIKCDNGESYRVHYGNLKCLLLKQDGIPLYGTKNWLGKWTTKIKK